MWKTCSPHYASFTISVEVDVSLASNVFVHKISTYSLLIRKPTSGKVSYSYFSCFILFGIVTYDNNNTHAITNKAT